MHHDHDPSSHAAMAAAKNQLPRWRRSLAAAIAAWRGDAAGNSPLAVRPPRGVQPASGETGFGISLLQLVSGLDVPLVLLGHESRIVAVSAGARQLVPALAPGKPIGLAMRDPDLLAAIGRVGLSGRSDQAELTEHSPLERSLRIGIAPLVAGGAAGPGLAQGAEAAGVRGPMLILTLQDLSELKTVERMRVDFVANASHELRTPLATLLGFIETLQGPAKADEKARTRFLGIMNDQARRMSRLIDDLLSLSRIEQRAHHAPQHPVDLVAIIREIIDSLSVMAAERGVLVQGPASGLSVMVAGDRDELLRLVENLVENAIKYGQGSKKQDGKKVDVGIRSEADQVILSVRDYGPGIPPEHIPRLTERFYRIDVGASREAGGTGLGLAIVKHIILRHRGRLTIESELGQGSSFMVALPLHRP